MSIFKNEGFAILAAIGMSLGGYLFYKNTQKNQIKEDEANQEQLDELIDRQRMLNILNSIRYKMKYYHRLAQSVNRQMEGKTEQFKQTARQQFFEKFTQNDYKIIVKNICQYEYGVSYEDFSDSLEYYAYKKDEEIVKIDDLIENEFKQNLQGIKTVLSPSNYLLTNIDKQTAKEIFKEIYCFKFYLIVQKVKEYLKTNTKIVENEDFYKQFENIYKIIDDKLKEFLLIDQIDAQNRNFNCFFELLVYYCEDDLNYSHFIREMEIQSILLFERILNQNDDIDLKYIKNQFKNL
ncbi:hypothetical protein TTHERM_00592810 (macronuclear) [Tetrahymena thermophila SB210]|uniref:Uncharacterized protein n=1 Tax=Tetrahymena thermophila (strain SB210) TaxID=312017 RepID=Q232L7_TETTS|nr:hypothetical protein TTHERM_00592810 [Tetrahymena thermophila SB210]EAR91395.1 hypothetical protein TTHERM_00592810 [Tetrahymena thermophila SB210]|eukprot:XP_001011640.1 hypothetical protein TTHERM_00592810 [Tetrahymena thermophila SB210]